MGGLRKEADLDPLNGAVHGRSGPLGSWPGVEIPQSGCPLGSLFGRKLWPRSGRAGRRGRSRGRRDRFHHPFGARDFGRLGVNIREHGHVGAAAGGQAQKAEHGEDSDGKTDHGCLASLSNRIQTERSPRPRRARGTARAAAVSRITRPVGSGTAVTLPGRISPPASGR